MSRAAKYHRSRSLLAKKCPPCHRAQSGLYSTSGLGSAADLAGASLRREPSAGGGDALAAPRRGARRGRPRPAARRPRERASRDARRCGCRRGLGERRRRMDFRGRGGGRARVPAVCAGSALLSAGSAPRLSEAKAPTPPPRRTSTATVIAARLRCFVEAARSLRSRSGTGRRSAATRSGAQGSMSARRLRGEQAR